MFNPTSMPPSALQGVISSCKAELSELYAVVQQEQRRKLQRWQDEEPMLECQIEALTGTRDIIQREQKQLTAELANLKSFLEKQAAEVSQQGATDPSGLAAADDEARLQQQLQELTAKIADLDEELTALVPMLSGSNGAACRPDELSYYETKLVVIQDTRRLLQSEATALSAELKRRQAAARLAADKHTAAQLGLSDLGRLGERLAGVEAALDRAKVERYFPAQRGFRFSGGGGGVYCGVKDLHLAEVSGAFSISLEAVPAAPGSNAAAAAAGSNAAAAGSNGSNGGAREVRLKVTLSGIATGTSSQEYKQQQQAQKQQQAAKAAAQAKSLRRQQTYQQQQQGSPLRRSTTTHQHSQPDSPQRAAGTNGSSSPARQRLGGGFGSSGGGGSSGGNRRNAAIAKFLGNLNEKKEALSAAIKTSPLTKSFEGAGSPRGPGHSQPHHSPISSPGLARHLAGTFGDKATSFSQRREQQSAAAEEASIAQGLLGRQQGPTAGTIAAVMSSSGDNSGPLIGPGSCNSGTVVGVIPGSVGDSSSSTPGSSMLAPDDGGGRMAPVSVSTTDSLEGTATPSAAAAGVAAGGTLQPHSPTAAAAAAGHAGSQIGLQGRSGSCSSTGSGSWASLPQQEGPQDTQLKAKFGSMKGKLGGLLAESKQKLADSKQKLADSKLMQESKQKLADSKQKLADSKLFSESRAAAKHLLEDSKHLFEDSKAGIKKGLSNLQDKQIQQQHYSTPRNSIDKQQQQQQHEPQQQGSPSVTPQQVAPHQQQQQQQQGPPSVAHDPEPALDSTSSAAAAAATADADAASPARDPGAAEATAQPSSHSSPQAAHHTAATAAASFPAVAAATAAAASSGELDKQLLDEAWVGDEQGGILGGGGGGGSSSIGSSGWLGQGAGVAGGRGSGSRKGVVVMLLAEGLEILGEKGTKVPNIRAAQLGLEVECVLSASLTYSSTLGWQSAGLSFEVVSLERVVEGSNIPLPKTLIKSVLNLVMPSVFTKLLLTSLPHELGQFILDSAAAASSSSSSRGPGGEAGAAAGGAAAAVAAAGGAGVWLSGELCLTGPPLACLSACLTRSAEEVPPGRVSLTNFVQELRAAQKARALLNLPDPLHARALALLFTPSSPFCLLDSQATAAAAAGSNAAATAASSNAGAGAASTVLGVPSSLTLRELCRFFLDYSDSTTWEEICEMWQVALDAVCLHLARQEGLLVPSGDFNSGCSTSIGDAAAGAGGGVSFPGSGGGAAAAVASSNDGVSAATAAQQVSFSFASLLNGRVAGLVRKPVRLSFGLNKLLLGLDAAAGLAAARDYCERAAREFAEQAKGEDALLLLQRPLAQQVELLHLWHAALSTYLCAFLQQFKEAGGRVMVAADKDAFSIAVEELTYEGPLRLQIPLPLLADLGTGACTIDLSLPNPEFAVSSLANKLRFITSAISKAAFGKCDEECAASRHAAAVAEAIKSGTDMPLTMMEELEALMTIWNAGATEREQQSAAAAAAAAQSRASQPSGSSTGIKLSRAESSSTQRSSSTAAAAAAATASITRNSITNVSRSSSVNAAGSAPSSSPGTAAASAAVGGGAAAASGAANTPSTGALGSDLTAPGDGGSSDGGSGVRGMIGRVCLTKASAGLVLDERRLKELMAGGGLQDANLLGGLLGCFGQLFTATVAPGWPSQQQDSLLAASMDTGGTGSSSNGADSTAAPQAIVTLRNNEVTRVKANLEAASFESAVSPRIAVRLLHMLLLAVAHKFGSGSSKRLEVIHKVFTHVAEYLGRDCLDLLVCVDVAATATQPAAAAGTAGSSPLQQQGPALQLLLAGAAPGSSSAAAGGGAVAAAAAAGGGGGAAAGAGLTGCSSGGGAACCYIINDVNLLTVLETVRLLMDYST